MEHTTEATGLKTNVVGLLGAVTLGVVALSPAMTLYGCFGPAFILAGKAAPLAFVFALIATLPTATSYALLARDYPDSGSAASWMARASGSKPWGQWAGWIVFLYYLNNFVIQPVTVGVFLSDFLGLFGVRAGMLCYIVGALLCCVWPAWIVYRGISVSFKGALKFLLFESVVVTALGVSVIFLAKRHVPGTEFSLNAFTTGASPMGLPGISRAMVFGMLAFCGFDVISTLSDEAKMSRKMIPRATFLALAVFGVFVIWGVWGFSYAEPFEKLKAVADSGGMPISEIAREYWGRAAFLVPLTAISAALGIAIATSVGSSRVLFAMARQQLAPQAFSELHPRYRVPWRALNLVFGVGIVASVVTGAMLGPYYAYSWWGTTSTFFAMLTYLMVNVSNLVLFRDRVFRSAGGFLLHGVIPVFGIGADFYILVRSFFLDLWSQGWANGQSVIAFDTLCALVVAYFAFGRGSKSGLSSSRSLRTSA